MIKFIRVLVALVLLAVISVSGGPALVAGQSTGASASIEDFPPMPSDHPPGASSTARTTATAMGRGVNFGNMLEAPREGDWRITVRDEFIDVTAHAGFATVRLPVRWSNHAAATAPFTIDQPFFARVESVVDKLLAKGLYVVLNMHHYRQLDGDALDRGEFPVDDAVLNMRFIILWQQIAERFRDKNDHLLFELYNEPHGRLIPQWNDLAARALAVVRKTNPTRIVVISPPLWAQAKALSSLRLPNDANLIVTVHNYQPFAFTHQGATWIHPVPPTGVLCCNAHQQAAAIAPLATAKAWSDAAGYPIFLGEFGSNSKADMPSRVTFTRLMRDQAESRGFSWSYWELASGFGLYDPVAHAWRAPLKDALLGH
ncbi:MAG TPA: glycoside hydrolase family 5 protein [Candidatus Acidoferrales bacterium]|jgi:endoglucanase|nr:glycoside hydrolase family 5 protein [Candidatus Acidoferrales bacterium]